ncbi:Platelet-activating factor acetylhydrolase IB subunit gamma [Tupaia chinensis]|uniref:Platelet-activating factor acetylhydrolase IB subunit alpha1 n=1 Tax=Tupaia chinensis TaxID=246437 RepID=L9L8T6_TUPCH|nr:Platelet-activating factor acetylhydrolase IB subunit gamma [Tupaia chinensis]
MVSPPRPQYPGELAAARSGPGGKRRTSPLRGRRGGSEGSQSHLPPKCRFPPLRRRRRPGPAFVLRPPPSARVRASGLSIVWRGRSGRGGATSGELSLADLARLSCRSPALRMSAEENPASKPTPVQDVQGDGRWMSLVSNAAFDTRVGCVCWGGGTRKGLIRKLGGADPRSVRAIDSPSCVPQHHRFVADSKDKEPEVVFIGDSLVQLMHQCEIWRELFSPLHALNFGIGGDNTQHVLWRLENGELEHIRPKIVVVWVGTNNHGHTAEQVAGGIKAIVHLVNQRQPQARVVVLGLLPRGQHPNPLREKNRRVNELVRAALAGHPRAHFLDAWCIETAPKATMTCTITCI